MRQSAETKPNAVLKKKREQNKTKQKWHKRRGNENDLHRALGGSLDGLADLLVRGGLLEPHRQIHHRHVRNGHAEAHA